MASQIRYVIPRGKNPLKYRLVGKLRNKQTKKKITSNKEVGDGEEKSGIFKSKRGKRCIDWQHKIQTGPRSIGLRDENANDSKRMHSTSPGLQGSPTGIMCKLV